MPLYLSANSRNQHVVVAERALGRPLPKGAVVHHVDENRHNNVPSNLVICPSQEYHQLLHMRMRAKKACGNPNWRKCVYCKQYDAPENLKITPKRKVGMAYHDKCNAENQQRVRNRKKALV